jgi:hypothetical protein
MQNRHRYQAGGQAMVLIKVAHQVTGGVSGACNAVVAIQLHHNSLLLIDVGVWH